MFCDVVYAEDPLKYLNFHGSTVSSVGFNMPNDEDNVFVFPYDLKAIYYGDDSVVNVKVIIDGNNVIAIPNRYASGQGSTISEYSIPAGKYIWGKFDETTFTLTTYVEPSEEKKPPYTDVLKNKIKAVASMAKEDPSQETNIVWNEGQALTNDVMQTLADNPNISLTFNFIYKNESYSIYIPAGKAVVTDDPWYGPEWLIGTYGNITLTENSGQYRVNKVILLVE